MIYKFKSKAAGDVIMMGPTGDAVLRAAGREPAPQGIFEPAALPAARAAIEQAVADDDAARAEAEAKAKADRVAPARLAAGRDDEARRGRRRADRLGRVKATAPRDEEQA